MWPVQGLSCRRYSLDEIRKATNNFADATVIGYGGFGKVYQGVALGRSVAVKRLNELSRQGVREFLAEIEMLSKCHHRHIVSLVGYCDESGEKIVVYEFMHRGSLFHCLHRVGTSFLTMEQRLNICIGVARGLDYLHTGASFNIIHRDVKTANILLDKNWVAKISDLGLCRAGPLDQPCSEEVTDTVRGTRGYIPPEYYTTRIPSRKADVYAFGVVLLEVLCTRRAWDGQTGWSLVDWAMPYIKQGAFSEIVDPNIKRYISPDCLRVCAFVITKCLEEDTMKRLTMSKVVSELECALAFQEGSHPSSSVHDSGILNHFNRPWLETITEREDRSRAGASIARSRDRASTSQANSLWNATMAPAMRNPGVYLFSAVDRVVLFYSSVTNSALRIYRDCQDVMLILNEYEIHIDERDVYQNQAHMVQIQGILIGKSFILPQLFIRGNHVGGADEIRKLHESGVLKQLLVGFLARNLCGCDHCRNKRGLH